MGIYEASALLYASGLWCRVDCPFAPPAQTGWACTLMSTPKITPMISQLYHREMLCQPRETSPLPSPPVSLPVSVLSSTRMPTELPAPDIPTYTRKLPTSIVKRARNEQVIRLACLLAPNVYPDIRYLPGSFTAFGSQQILSPRVCRSSGFPGRSRALYVAPIIVASGRRSRTETA